MERNSQRRSPLITALVIASIALIPSCRRTPEEPAGVTPPDGAGQPEVELTVLELPQENPEIGISLNALPRGLVATYNEERAIEITDGRRPNLVYTFDSDLPGVPSRSPKTVTDYEVFLGKHAEGNVTDSGAIDTSLGAGSWAGGTYSAEEQSFGDVRIFVPHPSGTGTLILFAVFPAGEATMDEVFATMQEILSEVS